MVTFPVVPAPFTYPRLGCTNQYGFSSPIPTTAPTFSRYGLIVSIGPATDGAPIKALRPDAIVLPYVSATSQAVGNLATGIPLFGIQIWPGWWGTKVGSYLAAGIANNATSLTVVGAPPSGWSAAPFPALISTPGHLTDEVVYVTNITGTTFTITRNVWQSTGQAQPTGARIAQIGNTGPVYPTEMHMNFTPYCPQQPGTLMRWSDYVAQYVTTSIFDTFPANDGVFFDNCRSGVLDFPDATLDSTGTNVADGFNGPDGRAIFNGIQAILTAVRKAFAARGQQKVIMTNSQGWKGQSDGMYMESYQKTYGSSPPPFVQRQNFDRYLDFTLTAPSPVTLINYDVYVDSSEALSGNNSIAYTFNYQQLRFYLTQTLMGNGFFFYDWCPIQHGQTWVFDEYDQGAGTCLTAQVATTDTQLTVRSSAGFSNGQTIRVPHSVREVSGVFQTPTEDEIMTVNGTPPDGTHINVTRPNIKGTQNVGTKVLPDWGNALAPWVGWMGAALGPGVENIPALGGDMLLTGDFETSTPQGTPSGTYPATSTFSGWTMTVSGTGIGYLSADTNTFHSGTQSARILVTTTSANFYDIKFVSANITLVTGTTYTVSFWAKSDRQQMFQLRVNGYANIALQQITLTPSWHQYRMSFAAPSPGGAVNINFEVAGETGQYWFDGALFRPGDPNFWHRDFENAFALFNGTNAAFAYTLPPIVSPSATTYTTYQRLVGSQDPVANDGTLHAPGTSITVPALDGLVLQKA